MVAVEVDVVAVVVVPLGVAEVVDKVAMVVAREDMAVAMVEAKEDMVVAMVEAREDMVAVPVDTAKIPTVAVVDMVARANKEAGVVDTVKVDQTPVALVDGVVARLVLAAIIKVTVADPLAPTMDKEEEPGLHLTEVEIKVMALVVVAPVAIISKVVADINLARDTKPNLGLIALPRLWRK